MTVFEDTTIHTNRGDKLEFDFSIPTGEETFYTFKKDDKLTFGVYEYRGMDKDALLLKDFILEEDAEKVRMSFTAEEMKIGPLINRPTRYWYEIQLNNEQTVLGYDMNGAKILRLYAEGSDIPLKKEEVEEV